MTEEYSVHSNKAVGPKGTELLSLGILFKQSNVLSRC